MYIERERDPLKYIHYNPYMSVEQISAPRQGSLSAGSPGRSGNNNSNNTDNDNNDNDDSNRNANTTNVNDNNRTNDNNTTNNNNNNNNDTVRLSPALRAWRGVVPSSSALFRSAPAFRNRLI